MPSNAVNLILRSSNQFLVPGLKQAVGCGSVYRKMTRKANKAFRVRRGRDNAESDIGWSGSFMDQLTLSTFCTQTVTLVNKFGADGNFVTDSDSDGIGDTFTASNATGSMAGNVQTFTASAVNGYVGKNQTGLTIGHKMYACIYVDTDAGASKVQLLGIDGTPYHSGTSGYELLSGTTTLVNTYLDFKVRDLRTSGWNAINLKLAHIFDLTAIFGAGNEPSKAEMDNFIRYHAYINSESGTVGDGFVTTIYDQKGTYNVTQTTAAQQPAIVIGGAVLVSPIVGIPELRFDCVDDRMTVSLPNSTNYYITFGAWSDCQSYDIISESSGVTYFPAGSSGLQGISCSEFVYSLNPVPTAYMNNLVSLYQSDLHSDDLFRLRFYTAGAKTLSVTESGSGITFIDKSGTQNTSYSRTVDAFDWIVVRATNPAGITTMNFANKQFTGCIASFERLTSVAAITFGEQRLTGKAPAVYQSSVLTSIYLVDNKYTGAITDISGCSNLQFLRFYNTLVQTFKSQTVSSTLGTIDIQNAKLTTTAVNALLAAFVAAGRTTGTRVLNLGGPGNAAPTGQGIIDKATLVSRGWTVTTN
jgi:hypothetical protein